MVGAGRGRRQRGRGRQHRYWAKCDWAGLGWAGRICSSYKKLPSDHGAWCALVHITQFWGTRGRLKYAPHLHAILDWRIWSSGVTVQSDAGRVKMSWKPDMEPMLDDVWKVDENTK